MKHRLIIWLFLCFIYFACYFTGWVISLAFGEENVPQKTIVLCFDDGPRPAVLEKLLPVLENYKVPGTFFVMGWAAVQNKELVKKMHEAGHEIENHSWGHENFKKLFREKGAEAVKSNLNKTDNAIFKATDRHSRFFRPPYWEINAEIEQIVKSLGYTIMKLENPDINTMDYADTSKHRPAEVLIERVKKIIAERERQKIFSHILVFHELSITTGALETLIPYFQARGYKLVRLDECKGEKRC